jgi:DNA-binding NarL/FixJ family response regulator
VSGGERRAIVAVVGDLMDRSRISAAVPGATFAVDVAGCAHADVVVVDLARHADLVAAIRAQVPRGRIVAFGPHVDDQLLERARRDGADTVLPRSQFFRDPEAALSAGI